MEQYIREIIQGISNTYGKDFFKSITARLHRVIGADHTYIARIDEQAGSAQTMARVANGQLVDNIEFSLQGTPCARAAEDSICCYPEAVAQAFPNDLLLNKLNIKAYVGSPLHDSRHKVTGIIVAMYEQPIKNEQFVLTLFEVFSGRIAAEMERLAHEKSLELLNDSLEDKVKQRTAELSDAIANLKQTQEQLIESEKMAALANLVAGLSHEVNTPLGIAITAHSIMARQYKNLISKINSDQLTVSDMNEYRSSMMQALALQGDNLEHARDLLDNFKQTAADQHLLAVETINIKQYYLKILTAVKPILKTKNVTFCLGCPDNLLINTLPGSHAQIITNLVNNSIQHGFSPGAGNEIKIDISAVADNEIEVHFVDNGKGLSHEAKTHIFEPFYTTTRSEGGCGLGMSIIYNLIVNKLQGSIKTVPSERGLHLVYRFKASQK